jgi:hypothetical protein
MERSQLFDLMGELKLYGMKAAFDEIMTTAVKRQHEPQRIVSDLLNAEISEKQARSIKYRLTIAKLPLAKDLADFTFEGTPINETLVNDLAGGGFIAQQRNAVLVGGTGTGKSHLAIAVAWWRPRPVLQRGRSRQSPRTALMFASGMTCRHRYRGPTAALIADTNLHRPAREQRVGFTFDCC